MNTTLPLCVPAPAKLNLFLHITGRRADGYHNLQTVFQLLDWGDRLEFSAREDGRINLQGPDLGIADEDNLVVRAARALQRQSGANPGADIRLHKAIPSGGGLGGGSSDAASTLLGLNHLWQCGLTRQRLAELGAALGADVPVFVQGQSAWAEGIGEQLRPLRLPAAWFVIIKPDCHVSTGEIFSHRQLTRDTSPITMSAFFAGGSRNDCEALVRRLYPPVDQAMRWLEQFGSAKLTGTGACIFAQCSERSVAESIVDRVPSPWAAWAVAGINRSPALAATAML